MHGWLDVSTYGCVDVCMYFYILIYICIHRKRRKLLSKYMNRINIFRVSPGFFS